MTKKVRAILPQHAYEIVIDIIKSQGLDKREELITEQLKTAKDPEIVKSLFNDKPLLILSKIARKALEEKLSEDEVTSLLREKLRLDEKRGEALMDELKKKLMFFIEVVEVKEEKEEKEEEEGKKEEPGKEKEEKLKTKPLKEFKQVKKSDNEKEEENDPYRELID